MQIKDMTTDEFKDLIRETIVETLEEYLGDTDEGKEVKEEVKQKLLDIRKRREAGHRREIYG
ncbi:hypothetical protein Cri9333_3214 [Crinalium epipsammum PCC 9333]|uniref:Uncharacterized protein n=1 Tax=Crinalium epipsammum PCC 9333 TaxID=1173022 RepID=K9W2T1_9CYAN|nr:hypothetical protein [Crinalium epipsammum]AFZ14047.1 hypothetical protein Cri9333_3214 [Crinalium epipsammum PCC 9333]